MDVAARHDAWRAGDSYDAYMGRWSRRIASPFLDWLDPLPRRDWLDVGCGTGALSATVIERADPASLIGVDPSEAFVAAAVAAVTDDRATFRVGDARALDLADASRDVVVSGLMLNFVPDRDLALAEMRRVARPGGVVAFYVWDYPGGGLGFLHAFWRAAAALDPAAADLSEDRRFPFCTPDQLRRTTQAAGLGDVEVAAVEAATEFADFDDLWRPFTLGAGPAPGYCASLDPGARARLHARLQADLPVGEDGAITLGARAWGVRARVA
jgi:SAM-dependent methyltransferase